MTKLSTAASYLNKLPDTGTRMPAVFVGHGNPMNALESHRFTEQWATLAREMPTPKAILCVSAHWETIGTKVTAMKAPRQIYDMTGFPQELYDFNYPVPGSPEFAALTQETVLKARIEADHSWGIDHGTWSVLAHMYPKADIPCFQLSLDKRRDLQYHYDLAAELAPLREKGVLIIGSGNIVHNLRTLSMDNSLPYVWAKRFDDKVASLITDGNHQALINYKQFGQDAELSVNSAEHYIPLLYVLALQAKGELVRQFSKVVMYGSAGMRCVQVG